MNAGDLGASVREATRIDPEACDARLAADATFRKRELAAGTFDGPSPIVRLECAFYATDDEGRLHSVPRPMLELIGFVTELGLHDAGMSTNPQPRAEPGLHAQLAEVRARLAAADGLETAGQSVLRIGECLAPPRRGVRSSVTPGAWTRAEPLEAVADGVDLEAAIAAMQRRCVAQQRVSPLGSTAADWASPADRVEA